MKTKIKFLFGVVLAALFVSVASAQPYYGFVSAPAVAGGTTTNNTGQTKGLFGTAWTNSISGGSYTNLTLLAGPGTRELALQFTVSAASASTSNVVWTLARNVQGGNPTNTAGTGMSLELFATVTNTLSGTTPQTVVVNLTGQPTTPANVGVLTSFSDGAVPYIYLYSVNVPTGSAAVTNYAVYAAPAN
jgi:hypothetical protein